MTPIIFVAFVGIAVAIFVLGWVAAWVWVKSRGTDPSEALSRRISIGLSVFFAMVAILVAADVVYLQSRLNTYISQTLPRDKAQEACNTETIKVLTSWIDARNQRDAAMDARDDAAVTVLNQLIAGQQPNPQDLAAWRDAVATDRKVRAEAAGSRVSLPNC